MEENEKDELQKKTISILPNIYVDNNNPLNTQSIASNNMDDYNSNNNNINNYATISNNLYNCNKGNQSEAQLSSNLYNGESDIKDYLKKHQANDSSSDLFLTDKVRQNQNYNTIQYNDLIINLKDKADQPKSINPLFFIINGEKPTEKNIINPIFLKKRNVKTQTSSNNYISNFNKKKIMFFETEKNYEILQNKLRHMKSTHPSSQILVIGNAFNKAADDKIKISSDIRKILFNNPTSRLERNYKLIKDITKNELVTRSSGKGMFLYLNNFRNDQHIARKLKTNERLKKLSQNNDLFIDMRKHENNTINNNGSEPKVFDRSAQVFFSKTFMKMTYDDYQKIKKEKENERKQNEAVNIKQQKLYEKELSAKELMKIRNGANEIRDKRIQEALKKADAIDCFKKDN